MKTIHIRFAATAIALGAICAGTATYACFMVSPQPMQVWLDHIHVDITDQVAVKTYKCTFKNPNPAAVVGGVCYMELEPGAQVDDMSVLVDGQEMKAEILDVEKANKVFDEIVRKGGSPALLEYYGNQLIQTKVPKVSANGTVMVQLRYTTVLKERDGLIRMQMLNTNPKALMQPLQSASVTINIKSQRPIKNVYCPTHEIKIGEKEGWDVSAEWSQENYLPKHPFVLYYQVAEDEVGASVIAHRERGEQGTFMLMLSPTYGSGVGRVSESEILPKDVVFCVDSSGSMLANNKMEQARGALKYCVETLRKGDRFNIVDFSTVVRQFHDGGLVEFDETSKAAALKYIEKLNARGGTAIEEALTTSLKQLGPSDRLRMIVFATDGLPTIGERDPQKLLKTIAAKNTEDVRVFVFGEGFDVNTKLLDFLALDHRGEADYILPEENISQKISKFFDRVGSPILTDLEVVIDGLEVEDVYPRTVPDVYRGEQVILYGRYNGSGEKTVRVAGNVGGRTQTFEYKLTFPEYTDDDRNAFVPRLWAGQKVDFLLNELRKSEKPSEELVDEVTELAKRYGIITPYTSYLVGEDIAKGGPMPTNGAARPLVLNSLREKDSLPQSEASRRDRVLEAKEQADSRQFAGKRGSASALDKQVDDELRRKGQTASSLEVVRYIGTKTFYQRGVEWQESVFEPEQHKDVTTLKVGSDDYIQLLKQDGRVAKYFALGDVVLKIDGRWYRLKS